MAKTVTVRAAGLFLGPNDLGSIPEGALSVADNVVIRRDNVVEPRRGIYPVSTKTLKKLTSWKGVLIGHDGATVLSRSNAAVDAWTDYAEACAAPSDARVEFAEGGGDLYVTSGVRPFRLDALAGVLEGQCIEPCSLAIGLTMGGGGGTALAPLKTISYRVVFGKYDANRRLILGQPSGRTLVVNTSSSLTYDLSCFYGIPRNSAIPVAGFPHYLGASMPAGSFVRLYRTESVDNGIDPGDEHGLVAEEELIRGFTSYSFTRTAGSPDVVDIVSSTPHGWPIGKMAWVSWDDDPLGPPSFYSAPYQAVVIDATTIRISVAVAGSGYGTVIAARNVQPRATNFGILSTGVGIDTVPDGYLGAALYTNPSQGRGAGDAATPIYAARHLASYQGSMFYGDITYPSSVDLYLLAVGGTNGLQNSDTITLNGYAYTARTSGLNYTLGHFGLYTAGTPAENIRNTMASLCQLLDVARIAGGVPLTVYARMAAGVDDVPGHATVEEDDAVSALTVSVSRPTAWVIQNLKGPERIKNEIRWSMNQQPDMTAIVDYARIGNADSATLREVATRNALFIFKEDGLYILRGTVSPWTIELLDPSVILTAPESAVVLDNQIYCLTTRGVMRVSETGVTLLSRPIEPALEDLTPSNILLYAFGVGYEEDHAYLLWIPTSGSPTQAEEAYCYDVYTDSWVRRTDAAAHGVVHSRKLYLASGTAIRAERKLWTVAGDQDYELADDSFAVSITVGGTLVGSVTLADATNVLVGDALVQSSSIAIVTAKVGNVLTLDRLQTWTVAAATSYRAISSVVQWSPRLAGDPSSQNRFMEASLLFRNVYFADASIGIQSAHYPSWTTLPVLGSSYGWTGAQVKQFALRALIDREHAVSTQLDLKFSIAQALTPWRIQGLSVKHRPLSDRTSR